MRGWTRDDLVQAALTVLLAPVAVPIALIVRLTERPMERTADEVALYLRAALEGTALDGWDEFLAIRIADPELEDIRARAARIVLPLRAEGAMELRFLVARAERAMRRGFPERFDS
jgi:hypothetical protein